MTANLEIRKELLTQECARSLQEEIDLLIHEGILKESNMMEVKSIEQMPQEALKIKMILGRKRIAIAVLVNLTLINY